MNLLLEVWAAVAAVGAVLICAGAPLRKYRGGAIALGVGLMVASIAVLPLAPLVALAKGAYLRTDTIAVDCGENGRLSIYVARYALPRWLAWFATPDEPMPGGLYETQIVDAYAGGGQWWAATCWLWRNSLYGLAWRFGKPAETYLDLKTDGFAERGDLWRWRRTLGPVVLMCGWKVHRADFNATPEHGPYVAVPFASARRAKDA